MLKRLILIVVATVFFSLQFNLGDAAALEVDEGIRTIPLSAKGGTLVISNEVLSQGQRLFGQNCTKCHIQGKTKTNPNVGLGIDELRGAEPQRDNFEGFSRLSPKSYYLRWRSFPRFDPSQHWQV